MGSDSAAPDRHPNPRKSNQDSLRIRAPPGIHGLGPPDHGRIMSQVLEQIAKLRADAESAVNAASTSDELEQARVAHLGRKAELPNLLRGVAQLPPEERG